MFLRNRYTKEPTVFTPKHFAQQEKTGHCLHFTLPTHADAYLLDACHPSIGNESVPKIIINETINFFS